MPNSLFVGCKHRLEHVADAAPHALGSRKLLSMLHISAAALPFSDPTYMYMYMHLCMNSFARRILDA